MDGAGRRSHRVSVRRFGSVLLPCLLALVLALPASVGTAAQRSGRGDAGGRTELVRAGADPPRERGGRIVGGSSVPDGRYPFMVFLYLGVDFGQGTYGSFCGGTLIGKRHVLTAAHCVVDAVGAEARPNTILAVIGATDLDARPLQGVERRVVAVAAHPGYDPAVSDANDVAVLRLAAGVPRKVARPIRLVPAGDVSLERPGRPTVVTGWGTTSEGGSPPPSRRLRAAEVRVVGSVPCGAVYPAALDPAVMLCAAARHRDTCQGDSGGPIFVKRERRFVQIGITSFGEGCARPGVPGVYTRLSAAGIGVWVRQRLAVP